MQAEIKTPVVSVIVPIYKVESYLKECVATVLGQTLTDIEIILVDDGSPDNCPAMCDEYLRIDSRVKVIHKTNAGLGFARNSGLEIATGRWVCFVDSDDFIDTETLEVCVRLGDTTNADQVRFMYTQIMDGDYVKSQEISIDNDVVLLNQFPDKVMPMLRYIANQHSGIATTASAWGAIYRREAIVKSGVKFHSERELISEDYAFNIEFAAKSGAIAYTSYPFYFYRVNLKSLSKMYKPDRIERSVVFSQYLRAKLRELGYPDADFIAVGNMIGNLRLHLRHIYASDFTMAEKRRLHYMAVNHPYIKQIAAAGEYKRLSVLQRMAFACRNSYIISRVLTEGRAWMKSHLKK